VQVVRTGKPGRPRTVPRASYLARATHPQAGINLTATAATIELHRHTVRSYLRRFEIEYQHSDISDHDLDTYIRNFRAKHPDSGVRYIFAALRVRGFRLQKRRVMESLHRVDSVGLALRRRGRIRRRKYKVSRPQALWHFDGHHKLIRWGIVIHGIVDGYCRTVCPSLNTSLVATDAEYAGNKFKSL
jgi:hypothetical protein